MPLKTLAPLVHLQTALVTGVSLPAKVLEDPTERTKRK